MPEGDTIYRTATRLRAVLVDQPILEARSRQPLVDAGQLVGRRFRAVEARGKHLLLHLDDAGAIHSHLGMAGSWHVYEPHEPWRKPLRSAALTMVAGPVVVVCFSPKTLELLDAARLRRHAYLRRLGPDLLGDELDEGEVIRRFRVHDATPIGEAVMNQSIVCGIGNVYKSETLFLSGIDPFTPVAGLQDDEIVRIVRQARKLMARNLEGYPRRTRFAGTGGRQWVYRRRGEPCLRCGEAIRMRRQGDLGRSTYWCPGCQPAPAP